MSLVKKIKQKFSSKDAKALLENFISLSALQLIGMILPLITLPYVLRVLGFENYGIVVFAASLITYFQSLTDFSFKITAVRDVAINRDDIEQLNFIYSKVLIVKGVFLLLSLAVIGLIVLFYAPFYQYKEIYFYSSLLLVGYALFPEWFFQGIEQMRYITYLNVGIKLFFTICIFIFIHSENDYWIYPLLQSGGFIGAGLVGQFILMYKYKLKFKVLHFSVVWETVRSNFPLFVNQFVPTLYNNTSTFLLGLIGAKSLVGMYQAILTVVNLGITIIEIVSRVFFPFLNRKVEAFKIYRKLVLSIYLFIILLFLVGHKYIFMFLNIQHSEALFVLLILLIGVFGYVLDNIFGLNYFIVKRMDKRVMYNTIIFSLFGMAIAYPLIVGYGVLGCAITLSVTRLLMGGSLYCQYLKVKV
ncbi:oligosaccharide flippase family protein [Myroides profundi]|uniref:Polysaccharide transporter, PST family n=1 Tax=Myroides profundi TaxID=480520 RepID=A0AAJ4W729_MYRPR|nr:oligosaccharide flippase family protein [Myroides profundi]AJH15307.1 polysaccharide transporter, PST family [Myroides profundi]SER65347.1 polysaccharide transporter, PST family [Myroides profundi]